MMAPHKITFYVYADSEQEARMLQDELFGIVDDLYRHGRLVTASRMTEALRRYGIFIGSLFR